MDRVTNLAELTRQEVKRYAGYSPLAKLYPVMDDDEQTYTVIIIEDHPQSRTDMVDVVVMAKIIDDYIVILEDTTDKPLVDALMINAGIPRDRIILAYAGEKLPEK